MMSVLRTEDEGSDAIALISSSVIFPESTIDEADNFLIARSSLFNPSRAISGSWRIRLDHAASLIFESSSTHSFLSICSGDEVRDAILAARSLRSLYSLDARDSAIRGSLPSYQRSIAIRARLTNHSSSSPRNGRKCGIAEGSPSSKSFLTALLL